MSSFCTDIQKVKTYIVSTKEIRAKLLYDEMLVKLTVGSMNYEKSFLSFG
jgi:hypothetical protein